MWEMGGMCLCVCDVGGGMCYVCVMWEMGGMCLCVCDVGGHVFMCV